MKKEEKISPDFATLEKKNVCPFDLYLYSGEDEIESNLSLLAPFHSQRLGNQCLELHRAARGHGCAKKKKKFVDNLFFFQLAHEVKTFLFFLTRPSWRISLVLSLIGSWSVAVSLFR